MKKQKNPLNRRLWREIREDIGKYIVIFLLMAGTIGLISGYIIANDSMLAAYDEGYVKYNLEEGHLRTEKALTKKQWSAIENLEMTTLEDDGADASEEELAQAEKYSVVLYENFYVEKKTADTADQTNLRIYADREEINLECLMSGRMPENDGEICVDRLNASYHKWKVGDTIAMEDGSTYTITGFVALPDYSCLFESNTDSMFDADTFGIGIVTENQFSEYPKTDLFYNYAWKYVTAASAGTQTFASYVCDVETDEKNLSQNFLTKLNEMMKLKDFLPRYQNQGINFTAEDIGGDKAMMIVLLYIMIAIMAFVFGVTTNNTITKESNVIGTLRASGYTRGEIIRHYMAAPVAVTMISALIGNILGYSFMRTLVADVYYNSYSLATYVTIWNANAFWETTLIPVLIMIVIVFLMLNRKMKLSPQQFLRRDLSGRKHRKNALHLPEKIPFFHRFRTRVIFQNLGNYLVLTIGILFANLLLIFGLGFPDIINRYSDNVTENMISKYQYMLDIPVSMQTETTSLNSIVNSMYYMYSVETDNPDAEKFMAASLLSSEDPSYKQEEITVYGVEPDSRYVDIDTSDGTVYVSSAYVDKYFKTIGDTVELKEKYEDKTYSFTIGGIYDYDTAVSVFMSREQLNETLGYDKDMFAGYFSDSEITDINEEFLGTIIDQTALTKMSRQLMRSMGGMMNFVVIFAIVIFIVLIYLLSKIVIEKNAQSISMAKILGYSRGEIARLYIVPTSIAVVAILLISLPLEKWAVVLLFHYMMLLEMTGWLPLALHDRILVEMFFMGLAAYAVVAALEIRRINRIPMDMALKNVE